MSVAKVRPRKGGWGIVTADVMLNIELSSDARFLLAMVATLTPDWEFHVSWLRRHTGWGKDKLQKVMRELEGQGHLIRVQFHEDGGTFGWNYEFLLEAEPRPENQAVADQPEPEKPAPVKPALEKPAPENTAIYHGRSSAIEKKNKEKGRQRVRKEVVSKPSREWLESCVSDKEKEYLESK